MWSTPSLPSLPGPLWPGVVAPDKGPIYGLNRIKPWFLDFTVFAFKLRMYAKLNHVLLECKVFNSTRKRYFQIRNMKDLFENFHIDDVLSFLKEIGLY